MNENVSSRKLTIFVPEETYQKIIEFANNGDYSVSKACRMLIDMGLNDQKRIKAYKDE